MNGRDGRSGIGAALLDRGPLVVLAVFSVVAVAGYWVFGRDPARALALSPSAAEFYAISFGFFAKAQVLLAGLVLMLKLCRRSGVAWVPAFALVYLISLGSELLGTAYGVPFGPYAYTDLLGLKWLGLVPVLIPLSWFYMAVPAYGLAAWALESGGRPGGRDRPLGRAARKVAGGIRPGRSGEVRWWRTRRREWMGRVLLGSLLLLAWDLSLDPAMSEVTRYWVWGERGPYYGMPLLNLVGWYVTGVALMGTLEWLGADGWLSGVSPRWQAGFYGANLILPLGMCLAAGLWGAAVVTALVLGGVVVWASLRSRPSPADNGGSTREDDRGGPEASSGVEVVG